MSLATRSLHARGTVQQMNSAFGVTLGTYESAAQGQFRGREGSITVPAALDGIITGVFGLDDRRVARRRTTPTQTGPAALTPADFEARYQFPPGDGAGQAVAIAELGGAYFPTDVQAFCQKYGLPVPAITPVSAGWPLLSPEQIQQLPVPVALSVSWGLADDNRDWSSATVQEINQRLQARRDARRDRVRRRWR